MLPIERFPFYTRYGRQTRRPLCRTCFNAYYAERKALARERLLELKRGKPCVDCKLVFNPWQMQYDHVRGEKVADVGELLRSASFSDVLMEIEKCDLVCANCHADRTYRREQTAPS
jgi:hypothetical protein